MYCSCRSRSNSTSWLYDVGGVGLVAGDNLELAAPQAGGDLQRLEAGQALLGVAQRLGQAGLRQPEHPHGVLAVGRSAGDGFLDGGCLHRDRPHRLQFAGRTGEHHDRRLAGNDDTWRGPHRVDHQRSGRDHGLLTVSGAHGVEITAAEAGHQLLQDRRDLVLQLGVQHQLTSAKPGDRGNGHIVGCRPQPAAGDDQIHALGRHEAQLRLDVGCAVTADGDVGEFNSQLEEPIGDPWTIAIGNPTG